MTPKILVVGCDKGSWQMRGRQLGAAIGAQCSARPQKFHWHRADVVILVKRAAETWRKDARRSGATLIWDVLDFWRQPAENQTPSAALIRYVTETARALNVGTVIGATEAMAADIGGVYLPHHSRIGLAPTPIRDRARIVAYDGSERYLGEWRPALERACAARRLTFQVNPPDLTQADVLVAFRGAVWNGWACRRWKSGVKYVNAIAAGRPIVTQTCDGYREIDPVGVVTEHPSDLVHALELASSRMVREAAYEQGCRRAPEFTLAAIAKRYTHIIAAAAAGRAA